MVKKSKEQKCAVHFLDVTIDGIPSVEMVLEVPDDAQELDEPTPAMWLGIYISHLFKSGTLMSEAQKFIAEGQFKG